MAVSSPEEECPTRVGRRCGNIGSNSIEAAQQGVGADRLRRPLNARALSGRREMKALLVKCSWGDRVFRGATLVVGLTLGLFTELSAPAQQPPKVSRIGFLSWLGCS